ncbi:MAG: hypothetical protein QN120_04960 [Armatimonadota bacterium]|nr:hypothetical protein [Armatimonadota bacterium]
MPHRLTFTAPQPPEQRHGAHVPAALAFEGKGHDLDGPPHAVQTDDAQAPVGRSALAERDGERQGFWGHGRARIVLRDEHSGPVLERHLAGLVIVLAQQCLGGLVVEQQRSRRVNHEDGEREVACQVTHEDDLDRLLCHGMPPHARDVTLR